MIYFYENTLRPIVSFSRNKDENGSRREMRSDPMILSFLFVSQKLSLSRLLSQRLSFDITNHVPDTSVESKIQRRNKNVGAYTYLHVRKLNDI